MPDIANKLIPWVARVVAACASLARACAKALHRAPARPARLGAVAGVAFALAAFAVLRLPNDSPKATASGGIRDAPSSSTEAPASATGDPFGNEGAVATTSSEEAPAGSLNDGRFSMPLASWLKVTDRFGAPRGGGLVHGGIDLALDHHTAVSAACAGTVIYTGFNGVYGNHVIVDCGDQFTTIYGHLSQVLVSKGDAVDSSHVLGLSGSTGFATGEHLHFEIRVNDVPVNPENYLDFHIAPGTPLSDGPIVFPSPPTPTATATAVDEPPTETPTTPPPPPPPTATPVPPTATPTSTPTPTPKTAKKAPTPLPRSEQ
jgi:murein DD-endopeptidase MepM/ murein hydrolase activator NlpD